MRPAVIGAHNLYEGGNFTQVSDTPGAHYRPQLGFAQYPAAGLNIPPAT